MESRSSIKKQFGNQNVTLYKSTLANCYLLSGMILNVFVFVDFGQEGAQEQKV